MTIHIRHHHVKEDQVRGLIGHAFQRLLSVLGEDDATVRLQQLGQPVAVGFFVIDDENGLLPVHGSVFCAEGARRLRH